MNNPEKYRVDEIPLDLVQDHHERNYARGEIFPQDVQALKDDIAQKGLLQPVIVTPLGNGKYQLVAGFCRTLACRLLGWKTIPAIVRLVTDLEALYINISENVQRTNLNKLQEAKAVQKILQMDPTLNEFEIAKKLNQSRGWVQLRKYILELPPEIQEDIAKDLMPLEHIRACWRLPTKEAQYEFVRKVKERKFRGEKIHLSDIEDEVLNRGVSKSKKVQNKERIFQLQDLVRDNLGNNLATRVLGWCAGEIPDHEIINDVKAHCANHGIIFQNNNNFGNTAGE